MALVHRPGRLQPLGPFQQMWNFGWFLALFFGVRILYITLSTTWTWSSGSPPTTRRIIGL